MQSRTEIKYKRDLWRIFFKKTDQAEKESLKIALCLLQHAISAAGPAKFPSNLPAVSRYFVVIVLRKKRAEVEKEVEKDMKDEISEEEVSTEEARKREKCIKQSVMSAAGPAKFPSNQVKTNQFTAILVLLKKETEKKTPAGLERLSLEDLMLGINQITTN